MQDATPWHPGCRPAPSRRTDCRGQWFGPVWRMVGPGAGRQTRSAQSHRAKRNGCAGPSSRSHEGCDFRGEKGSPVCRCWSSLHGRHTVANLIPGRSRFRSDQVPTSPDRRIRPVTPMVTWRPSGTSRRPCLRGGLRPAPPENATLAAPRCATACGSALAAGARGNRWFRGRRAASGISALVGPSRFPESALVRDGTALAAGFGLWRECGPCTRGNAPLRRGETKPRETRARSRRNARASSHGAGGEPHVR